MASAVRNADASLVYSMTPETPFTPTSGRADSRTYKVGAVVTKTESRHVEYKAGGGNYPTQILPSHVRRYGSAFLNSGGGKLCIGVTDDGVVAGIRATRLADRERIKQIIVGEFSKFTPAVKDDLYEIRFVPCNKQGYFVLEIDIRSGNPKEIYSDGEDKMYYKRDGSVEGPLWPNRIKEIVTSKFIKSLEEESQCTH